MSVLATTSKLSMLSRQISRVVVNNNLLCRSYATMNLTFSSASGTYYNNATNVKQVDVPAVSGSFGILPEHVPSLAVLKAGVLTVFEEDASVKKYFVSSGSVTINDDSSVQILAEEAVPVDMLDAAAIRDGAAKAAADVNTASNEIDKAKAMVAVECYEALAKAVE